MGKKNRRSADAVADYFLLKIHLDQGDLIGNLKMQKLCYFAQGWALAKLDRSLFDDSFEAWALGPAIPNLFRRFKPYRWGALDSFKLRTNPMKELDGEERELLDWVWEEYGHFHSSELAHLVRTSGPWKEVYGDRLPGTRCDEEIRQKDIKAYFQKLKSSSPPKNPRASPDHALA